MVLSEIAGNARKEKEARDFENDENKRIHVLYKKSPLLK